MEKSINKTVLPEGITILSERISSVRSVSIGIWIKAGSRTDKVYKEGMAHFIEHMMFKGTRKRSAFDIVYTLESLGGTLNAFTTRNLACYYATVLDENIEQAVDVLSDILTNSVFNVDEIEREKHVVADEIRSSQEIPEELALDTFTDMILSPKPESKPILGTLDSIQRFTRSDIITYLDTNYCAKNVVIAAAGNITHSHLLDLIPQRFHFASSSESPVENNISQTVVPEIHIKKESALTHICYGGRTFGYSDERRLSLWILNTLLGSGMSSRLFQNIREKHGLTYSIYSFTELLDTVGIIATYAATDIQNCDRTLNLIHKEYRRLVEDLIDDKSLNNVKSQLKGNVLLGLESSYNRMSRIAKNEIYLKEILDLDYIIEQINKVTAQEIMEVAQVIFEENNLFKTVLSL